MADCDVCGVAHAEEEDHVFNYVDQQIDQDLVDPISFTPFFDGVIFPNTQCQNSFSRMSIIRCLRTNPKCPLCRNHISMNDAKPFPLPLKNMLDKLKVFCPHSKEHIVPRVELKVHLTTCDSIVVLCQNTRGTEQCLQKITRGRMAEHQRVCRLRCGSSEKPQCGPADSDYQMMPAQARASGKSADIKPVITADMTPTRKAKQRAASVGLSVNSVPFHITPICLSTTSYHDVAEHGPVTLSMCDDIISTTTYATSTNAVFSLPQSHIPL